MCGCVSQYVGDQPQRLIRPAGTREFVMPFRHVTEIRSATSSPTLQCAAGRGHWDYSSHVWSVGADRFSVVGLDGIRPHNGKKILGRLHAECERSSLSVEVLHRNTQDIEPLRRGCSTVNASQCFVVSSMSVSSLHRIQTSRPSRAGLLSDGLLPSDCSPQQSPPFARLISNGLRALQLSPLPLPSPDESVFP